MLGSLFAAVPWGAPLPALQFSALGAHPAFIHTMVGDATWKDCWKEKHTNITDNHFVPYKLLNVIKWVVELLELQHSQDQLETGKESYGAAQQSAAQRRKKGSPY